MQRKTLVPIKLTLYIYIYSTHLLYHTLNMCDTSYLDKRIKKCVIPNKGFGMVATNDIKKGTILIKDIPFTITSKKIYSEIFQLIYDALNDKNIVEKFMKLLPKSLGCYKIDKNRIVNELKKVKDNDPDMYNFFVTNYTFDEILLLCAKYMSNGFEFKGKPCFLFTGTLLNHSCLPNVIFGEQDGMITFIAIRNIKKGEEICDNYIDITLPKKERLKQLSDRYGFVCCCERCNDNETLGHESFDNKSILIEKKRMATFGYSKSPHVS